MNKNSKLYDITWGIFNVARANNKKMLYVLYIVYKFIISWYLVVSFNDFYINLKYNKAHFTILFSPRDVQEITH